MVRSTFEAKRSQRGALYLCTVASAFTLAIALNAENVDIDIHEVDATGRSSPGHHMLLETLSDHPRVYRIQGLLSAAECDQLIASGTSRLNASEMGAADHAPTGEDDRPASSRTSSSMHFDDGADEGEPWLHMLRQRWANVARLPLSLGEPTQLARYRGAEAYGLHLDASEEVRRLATVLTYLSDVEEGGETIFPRIASAGARRGSGGVMQPLAKLAAAGMLARELSRGSRYCEKGHVLRIPPRKGDALLFFPLLHDGTPDHDTIHAGCAVRGSSDVKYVAQQWFTLPASWPEPSSTSGSEGAQNPRDVWKLRVGPF